MAWPPGKNPELAGEPLGELAVLLEEVVESLKGVFAVFEDADWPSGKKSERQACQLRGWLRVQMVGGLKMLLPEAGLLPAELPPLAEPGVPAPELGVPAAVPGVPAPVPGVPAPEPGVPAPVPGVPAAVPGVPAAVPGVPAPVPGVPAPVRWAPASVFGVELVVPALVVLAGDAPENSPWDAAYLAAAAEAAAAAVLPDPAPKCCSLLHCFCAGKCRFRRKC